MEEETGDDLMEECFPVLLIPKRLTRLDLGNVKEKDVLLDLLILLMECEKKMKSVYSGYCTVKIVQDDFVKDVLRNLRYRHDEQEGASPEPFGWLDMELDNICDYNNLLECQDLWKKGSTKIVVDGNITQVTTTIITHTQTTHKSTSAPIGRSDNIHTRYSPESFRHKKFRKSLSENDRIHSDCSRSSNDHQTSLLRQSYNEIKQGDYFLESSESEEYTVQTTSTAAFTNDYYSIKRRKILKDSIALTEQCALRQLMSPEIQTEKHPKTILYSGGDSQVVRRAKAKAEANQPFKSTHGDGDISNVFEEPPKRQRKRKREDSVESKVKLDLNPYEKTCKICTKSFRDRKKFKQHSLGHGDPNVECDKCFKVLSSKYSLRNHKKIHQRPQACDFCSMTYDTVDALKKHQVRMHSKPYECDYCRKEIYNQEEMLRHIKKEHFTYFCSRCCFSYDNCEDYLAHMKTHQALNESDVMAEYDSASSGMLISTQFEIEEIASPQMEMEIETYQSPTRVLEKAARDADLLQFPVKVDVNIEPMGEVDNRLRRSPRIRDMRALEADAVIAKVLSNEDFLLSSKRNKKTPIRKTCVVCKKRFDRLSDLKRHLIEHVIRSTLAKGPVDSSGSLCMLCDICKLESFCRTDKYKAHLREHAKLTIYKCTHCDKSFSDSSNFSKHKKLHGEMYFQCDLCSRRFKTKKALVVHIARHDANPPVPCNYCGKLFHFMSMLKKHIKNTHYKEAFGVSCKFCPEKLRSLKDKWDHEWKVHNVRKTIADCALCKEKFRKYSELKRHCLVKHSYEISKV
ncbi:unnamed protein product [Leptosia nina]|uniref:C2H2-type domain-containing protein n=1 Tax=Leptosia nina TaxID=320188 RepID=A0AAV1J4J2_9NEOP